MDTDASNGGGTKDGEIRLPVPEQATPGTQIIGEDMDKALLDSVSEIKGRFVPEREKLKRVSELGAIFSKAANDLLETDISRNWAGEIVKKLAQDIEDSRYVEALGDINMQGLRFIVTMLDKELKDTKKGPGKEKAEKFNEFIEKYKEICKKALSSQEKSSEPVREQIFLNICDALNIPAYPIERLDRIYNDYNEPSKRKGIEMRVEMNRDLDDEIENQPGLKVFLEQQNTFWDTKRIQYFKKSENEWEVVKREWEFWKSMNERKFLIRQSRMQSLKKLIDGEMSVEDMQKENEKYSEIKSWKMN